MDAPVEHVIYLLILTVAGLDHISICGFGGPTKNLDFRFERDEFDDKT